MDRILVALDRSPRAAHVLEAAVDFAKRTGAKVRLMRAVSLPPELPANLWPVPPARIMDDLVLGAKHDLRELAKSVPDELLDGATTQIGTAWDAVCSAAREYDADLIVIGSHGYGLLDRLLGTTAAKVVNHADRSVLVVREHHAVRTLAMILRCAACDVANRIPALRIHERAHCGRCKTVIGPPPNAIGVHTAGEFDDLIDHASVPIITDFWAPWCGPCLAIAPQVENLARARVGRAIVLKVNTDELTDVASRYGIRSIPTLILFEAGREVRRISGAMSADAMAANLRV